MDGVGGWGFFPDAESVYDVMSPPPVDCPFASLHVVARTSALCCRTWWGQNDGGMNEGVKGWDSDWDVETEWNWLNCKEELWKRKKEERVRYWSHAWLELEWELAWVSRCLTRMRNPRSLRNDQCWSHCKSVYIYAAHRGNLNIGLFLETWLG